MECLKIKKKKKPEKGQLADQSDVERVRLSR